MPDNTHIKPDETVRWNGKDNHIYNSVESLLDQLTPRKVDETISSRHCWTKHSWEGIKDTDRDWCGGRNYSDAFKQITSGDNNLSQDLMEIRDAIVTECDIVLDQAFYLDVTGGMVDIGAFMSGEPECMFNTREEETQSRKVLKLIFNVDASAGISQQSIVYKGAAIMALLDGLAATKQYHIEAWAYWGNNGGDVYLKLCDSSREYDPSILGYALSDPGMLRKFLFAYWISLNSSQRREWYRNSMGLGQPVSLTKIPPFLGFQNNINFAEDTLLYGSPHAIKINSKEAAVEWVKQQISKVGGSGIVGIDDCYG